MASDGTRPRLLDVFCGEGGAAMGYSRAGFDVFGVDLNDDLGGHRVRRRPRPLKRYPFESAEGDALEVLRRLLAGGNVPGGYSLSDFAAVHASPPCQLYSPMRHIAHAQGRTIDRVDLIAPTRELLKQTGLPYVIENVEPAPLDRASSVLLCGSMFDPPLDVQRHRLFECNWPVEQTPWPCRHKLWSYRFRSADYRGRKSGRLMKVVPVYGGTRYVGDLELRRRAMEIDWMTGDGLNEAIPPRYTEFVGAQLLAHVTRSTTAAAA